MADSDWGWRKRGEISEEDDHEGPVGLYANYLMKKGRGYKHRPNYGYLAIPIICFICTCNLIFLILSLCDISYISALYMPLLFSSYTYPSIICSDDIKKAKTTKLGNKNK